MSSPLPFSPPFGFGNNGSGGVMTPPNIAQANAFGVPMTRSLDLPLPEVYPIPDAHGFNPLGSMATTIVQAGIAIPGASLNIPTSSIGVIAVVTLYITNMLTTTDVRWTVLVNGNPVSGYQGLRLFPRNQTIVENNISIPIRIIGNADVTVTFDNNDGGTYVVGAALSGWLWPVASDDRWKNSGG